MTHEMITLSRTDLKRLVKETVKETLFEMGLRADDPEAVEEARKDFTFVRRWRMSADGAATKVGWFVMASLGSGLLFALWQGIKLTAKAP